MQAIQTYRWQNHPDRRVPMLQYPPVGLGTRPMSRLDYAVRADRAPQRIRCARNDSDVLPDHVVESKKVLAGLNPHTVLSANTTLEKSTVFMRDSEIVVDPHSMSAVSLTIASNRVRSSTATHFILSATFSCASSDLAMRSQSSIV